MPSKNQMLGLMKIAWMWCERDIYAVFRMWIGMMLFILVWVTFTIINVANHQPLVLMPNMNIAGTQLSIVILAAYVGFFNAWSMLTFLAIVVCLLEYAGNFLIAAYNYDNRSWEIVNAPRAWLRTMRESSEAASKSDYEEYRKKLDSQIAELKSE